MKLRTYLSIPQVVVASLVTIPTTQWLLTTNERHYISPQNDNVL